jgi:hypothetical protein
MRTREISSANVRPDPSNSRLTIPQTFGVWEVPVGTGGKRYRYGNNPIRGAELTRECGAATRIALYTDRRAAKSRADEMNR